MKHALALLLSLALTPCLTYAGAIDGTKLAAETKVRNLVEPLLTQLCGEKEGRCKLLSLEAEVKVESPETLSPGFEEYTSVQELEVTPAHVTVKILMDSAIGPKTRSNITNVIEKHLSVLEFKTDIQLVTAEFPQPLSSARKINELRDTTLRAFRKNIDDLIKEFCPKQCILADADLKAESVNPEEVQFGSANEFVSDGDAAIRVKRLSANLLFDTTLTPEEQTNLVEMARLKTTQFKNVDIASSSLRFPHPVPYDENGNAVLTGFGVGKRGLASKESKESLESKSTSTNKNDTTNSNAQTNNNKTETAEKSNRQERFEKFEKIERVENGDAVQKELEKFKVYGLIFGVSTLLLLILLALASLSPRKPKDQQGTIHRIINSLTSDPNAGASYDNKPAPQSGDRAALAAKRFEIERLIEELSKLFAEHPRVAKHVFGKVLVEEGIEVTAQYIEIFGEGPVLELLRDPSLQSDIAALTEYYAKTQIELDDDTKHQLLKALHNRSISAKMVVLGNRTTNSFDFLVEMDGRQILELILNESMTVKAVVMTQIDSQKRSQIFANLDPDTRMKLLAELSRIDHLPKDYIFNAATALRRKRTENPRLNTEALPGSDVLVTLLERAPFDTQRTVVRQLDLNNPDTARSVKSKLVSVDTLRFLRDNHLLDVVLSLKHDELLAFLGGTPKGVRDTIFAKSPKELSLELEEELTSIGPPNKEAYLAVERKIINRMKIMTNDGTINLIEVNERMFGEAGTGITGVSSQANAFDIPEDTRAGLKKVVGW